MTQPTTVSATRAPTRVALASCAGIIGDLIRRRVSTVTDMVVVDEMEAEDVAALMLRTRAVRPDVVIWQLHDEPMLSDHPELFGDDVGLSVLAVVDDGRRGSLWRLRPHRTRLDPLSVDGLINAIRVAAMS